MGTPGLCACVPYASVFAVRAGAVGCKPGLGSPAKVSLWAQPSLRPQCVRPIGRWRRSIWRQYDPRWMSEKGVGLACLAPQMDACLSIYSFAKLLKCAKVYKFLRRNSGNFRGVRLFLGSSVDIPAENRSVEDGMIWNGGWNEMEWGMAVWIRGGIP